VQEKCGKQFKVSGLRFQVRWLFQVPFTVTDRRS
jgi:hypothetical protein